MLYQIWSEGFLITGMEGVPATATLEATVEADSFQEACDKHYGDNFNYNSQNLSYWGCRLYPTEKQARKLFG